MTALANSRTVLFTLLSILPVLFGQDYKIPNVSIQAFNPKGIRLSIPDTPGMNLFAFQGRINRHIVVDEVGEISAEVRKPKEGFWSFQDNDVTLKVGDSIHYYAVVIKNKKNYRILRVHLVREILDPNQPSEPSPTPRPPVPSNVPPSTTGSCRRTDTLVLSIPTGTSTTACAGQIIFEDNFDTLNENLWTIEQFIPSKPEYPFVSYQKLANSPTVFVQNGTLHIEPKLQEELPGFDSLAIISSKLDLTSGCTRAGHCEFNSDGGQILPPIASGRITNTFAFKYGFIEIRAKVPLGDWLYPDILLESLFNRHGTDNYASGVVRIAGVRGNRVLTKGPEEYGNKVLYGGPMMDFKCRDVLLEKMISTTEWGNDFHVYTLRWAPELMTLIVDGEEWGRIEPPASGLHTRLPKDTCEPPRTFLTTRLAPFDEFFTIALGVSAGGVSEFPDKLLSLYESKPWINSARRARLNFFRAKSSWQSTWTQPSLLIDYVKVRAL